jgi:hypothetical protein
VARIQGIDPKRAPFPMGVVLNQTRKMLGRDLTPQLISARVPRVFWLHGLIFWLFGRKAKVPQRAVSMVSLRTAVRVGCPF